jgi:hypothetical protein
MIDLCVCVCVRKQVKYDRSVCVCVCVRKQVKYDRS